MTEKLSELMRKSWLFPVREEWIKAVEALEAELERLNNHCDVCIQNNRVEYEPYKKKKTMAGLKEIVLISVKYLKIG